MRNIITMTIATVATTAPAFAATGNVMEHTGLLAWTFFGFCAVIVIAQIVPAALLLIGMVRGFVTRETHEVIN